MDVSLIIKSRNVFSANTGTFVCVFLVVTRENAKMKYSDCEVISHYVSIYSDTDCLGKVGLFFICYRVLFIQIVSQIDRKTFRRVYFQNYCIMRAQKTKNKNKNKNSILAKFNIR